VTLAAPLFAWVAAAVAVATVALHLLAWRKPPESPLPTARFVPEAPIRTVSRAVKPTDLALLALRVLTVLLVGVALAGPTILPRSRGLGRVVVVDRSRTAVNGAIADAARRELRTGDALVLFDSAAREVSAASGDSIGGTVAQRERGSISAALIAAARAARRLQRAHDSVEIVVVSPVAVEELDEATAAIRRTWRGALRVVRAGSPPDESIAAGRPEVRPGANDAISATFALSADASGGRNVRVVRGEPTLADSAWARGGHALVVWPAATAARGWQARSVFDTAFAVTALAAPPLVAGLRARPATVVAPFARVLVAPPGRVVARWQDGEPAATETTLGTGCVRSVAVAVPTVGDLVLTPAFRRFATAMAAPCEGATPWRPVPDSVLVTVLPAHRTTDSVVRASAATTTAPTSWLAAWLLGAALVAALAELFVRRGSHATA
jgi:hypothetical protein